MGVEKEDPAALAAELALAVTRLRARIRTEVAAKTGHWAGRWTWAQMATLTRIIDNGPITASELAKAENMRQQSMSELLANLREDGLIRSEKDPADGRKSLLEATSEGRAVAARLTATRKDWLESALREDATAAERKTVQAAVQIINRLVDSRK
ncbi:MarR family winged helix-turn-helix transcriptional regulator [Nocardia jiangxiensis]|uniref:MarR family winged helix-turn-helix transcriptional regulator n=1 Tax=Nocardia jiangxiensis TaxID=282685 RepID=A0ABW6SEA2_9NOCA|nr:MarR family transcriptional regulator [Nocardia jiangxiensis]